MKIIIDLLRLIGSTLTPPRAFSWQTLILLSLFSWLMSFITTNPIQNIIASCGWIFLIGGVSWVTTENPPKIGGFSIGPWITGALVCIFIFGSFRNDIPPAALICWPPISAILACIREVVDDTLKIKRPPPAARQRMVILISTNILISCWFQFYFVIQNWIEQYPTLVLDDFRKSAFVTKLEYTQTVLPRGGLIANLVEPKLKEQLNNQPWPLVERWLINSEANLNTTIEQVKNEVSLIDEDAWWRFKPEIKSIGSGYKLKVIAIWQGPRSQPGEYYIEKSCQINQVYRNTSNKSDGETIISEAELSKTQVGEVKCDPLSKLWYEQRQPVQQ